MKKYLVFVLLAVVLNWGCAIARIYPVQGPLAARKPAPVYNATIRGAFFSGTLSTTLNDGERFKVPMNPASSGTNTAPILESEWESVYGTGYYQFKVMPAQYHLRGASTGSKGTELDVEVYKNEIRPVPATKDDHSTIELFGVAKDSNGNVYKVILR